MKFKRAQIDAIGYELAPVVVTSAEIEKRLAPLYEALHMAPGQIEELTGIVERRYWEEGVPLSRGMGSENPGSCSHCLANFGRGVLMSS